MRKGDVVVSRRHKGLIRVVIVYTNGGGVGKKLKKDGMPYRREVCFGPGDSWPLEQVFRGCGPVRSESYAPRIS